MHKLDRYTPYALAALRIAAALIFVAHGAQKLFGFPAPPEGGLPAVGSLLWVGAWIELVGGTLLLGGLYTRAAAFISSGTMAVAYWQFHAIERGKFLPIENGGELAALYAFVFLFIAVRGAGLFSVDRHIGRA